MTDTLGKLYHNSFVSTKQTPSDAEYTDCAQDSAYNILITKSLVNLLLLQLEVYLLFQK